MRRLLVEVIGAQEFDGKAELVAQVASVEVVGGPPTFLELAVAHNALVESTFEQAPGPRADMGCE